jgi:hypothetical protein
MWIEREISEDLRRAAITFPVIALVGPRQVGKSSLLEKIFPKHRYISFDVGTLAKTAETRPQDFLSEYTPPVILDEIQYAPSFFRHIKTYVDSRKSEKGLFILTGSQNFLLMENLSESLAGRAAVIPFLGLSAFEWRSSPISAESSWKEFLWRGGFPALWAEKDNAPSKERWYQGYVATYLERDVRNLLNVGSLRDFERFLRAAAGRCGRTLNISELGRDVGISTTTARQWLSVLQASNQVFLLEPYHRSLGKRLAKSPKLYFTDTGLVSYLMGYASPEALWSSKEAGALWETHVINQWLRRRDWHDPSLGIWYWRDQAGNEVDLLLEKNQKLIAVECKLTEQPDPKDAQGINRLKNFYGAEQVRHGYLACPIETPFDLSSDITVVNGWKTWEI